jgi:hypothetical protein
MSDPYASAPAVLRAKLARLSADIDAADAERADCLAAMALEPDNRANEKALQRLRFALPQMRAAKTDITAALALLAEPAQ